MISDAVPTVEKSIAYKSQSVEVMEEALSYSELQLRTEIDYRAVKIYENDYMHEIYTLYPDKSLPHIVLLHGFGGTAMTYVRLFKPLRIFYQVHALDAFGVGYSSRGNFKDDFTYEQTRDYFIDAIEQWRKAVNIEKFVLVGHSFGGYLATCYAQKYSGNIDRLILLSPVGATQKTEQQIEDELRSRVQPGLKGKVFKYLAEKVYNMRIRPSRAMGSCLIGNKLVNQIVENRLKLQDKEKETWKTYFKDLSTLDASSESGFYILFEWPLKPKHTIESILQSLKLEIPIEFYYGQHDWMDSKGARRLAESMKNVSFAKVPDAGHQLIFDNPQQICQLIVLHKFYEQQQQ